MKFRLLNDGGYRSLKDINFPVEFESPKTTAHHSAQTGRLLGYNVKAADIPGCNPLLSEDTFYFSLSGNIGAV